MATLEELRRRRQAKRERRARKRERAARLRRIIARAKENLGEVGADLKRIGESLADVIRRIRRKRRRAWPSGRFTELLYHDPPHLHAASADRDFLIRIAKIGQERYGLTISEFPPFDYPVECVHVTGSWHYRDSSAPYVPRTCANQGDGLAFDANGEREYEFYLELRRRYVL